MTTWTSADERVQLFCGDNREALKKLGDNSIDAIVTDPPYALTNSASSKTGFMGEEWDGELPGVDTWKEALRVAKPGAHLLAFGGSRTYHRLACAIEDAGWEIRDGLSLLQEPQWAAFWDSLDDAQRDALLRLLGPGILLWVYATGFPKSLDISKEFDRRAGVERQVVGTKVGLPGYSLAPDQGRGVPCVASGDSAKECLITAPVTDLARQWEGWGTALKPSWEPIILARKPMLSSVADNVREFSTGGLNIDGCRIRGAGEEVHTPASDPTKRQGTVGTDLGITRADTDKFQAAQAESVARTNLLGRWPANLLLQHAEGCRCVGTTQVRRSLREATCDLPAKQTFKGWKQGGRSLGETEETVENWECVPNCPVRMLGEQSGESSSSGGNFSGSNALGQDSGWNNHNNKPTAIARPIDKGTAARFFFCAKPARWERDEGAPSETLSGAEAVHRQEGSKGLENPRAGSGRTADKVRNFHPTVKPVSLMRELVRLVTPPEGIVLDLFMGSGSTGIACVFEGFRFLGVEREEKFFDLAKERIDYAQVKKQVASKLPTNMLTPKVRPLPPPPEEPLPGLGLSKSKLEKLVRKASKR